MSPRDTGPEPLSPADDADTGRRHWISVLAKADRAELESAWAHLSPQPAYSLLRRPETGLVMIRGRIGGTGDRFNLGEMTMTRCAVRMDQGAASTTGFSFVAGRDHRHAELAAVFDALLQDPTRRSELHRALIEPLAQAQQERRRRRAAETAATRVEFFTMVRE
jgi:alpha-D-ribose 1-methylphosphonate 5-triphosphate synthase subunit PhnG